MKIVNGKIIPEYHPQIASNARAFMDRVQVQGVNEARELVRSADFLEALLADQYIIVPAPVGGAASSKKAENGDGNASVTMDGI